jgi:hypothetical protein
MHRLDGPRFKVTRAQTQIDQLRLMQDIFFKNTRYSVVRAEQNAKTGKRIYRIKIDGPPPSLDWGIYIGEIAHNLRSALNQLVYQLAILNTANKPEAVETDKLLQFPISLRSQDFKKGNKAHNMIRLLRPEDKTLIQRLQPYKRSDALLLKTIDLTKWRGRRSPLFWLEEINNADKHRIIQVVASKSASFGFAYWGERSDPPFTAIKSRVFHILKHGAKYGEGDPDVSVYPYIRPLIAFAEGCDPMRNQPVCLALNKISVTVSEILELFSLQFQR